MKHLSRVDVVRPDSIPQDVSLAFLLSPIRQLVQWLGTSSSHAPRANFPLSPVRDNRLESPPCLATYWD